ncbi:MAG: hypothetical protein WDA41_10195 [Candidatus Neomarinimicrobiota bacterium]
MEEYKEGLSSFGDSVTNLPNVKGANNVRALDRSIPYIIGKARIAPYVLSEGVISITGASGHMIRQVPYILGYSNLVLRKCFSNGRDVYTFTGNTPQQGLFLVPDITQGSLWVAQTGVQYTTYPSYMRNTYVTIDAGDQLLKADDPNYTALTYTLPENTAEAWVFLMFNGLRKYSSKGKGVAHTITLRLTYSINGGTTWNPLTSIGGETGDYVVSYNRSTQFRKLQSLTLPFATTSVLTEPIQIRIECRSNATSGALEDVFVQSILALTYDPQASIERNDYVFLPVVDEDVAKKCCIVGLTAGARYSEDEDAFRNLAFIVEGMARTWNGTTWGNRAPTRNPASWLFEILTSDVHPQSKIGLSEIDLDSFGELYEYCEEEGIEVNMVILEGEPKEKIIQKICDICYSTLYKNLDGKIAVATDKHKENAIAIINTQNCFSFTNKKDLTPQVDGLRITFINEDTDYEQDAYEVMRPGTTKDANSKIRALTVDGITKYEQIVKYAWRLMAIESARPKVTTVEIGNEGVYYTPLSKVLVQHPSLKNGLGSAEIKNVVMSGTDIIGLDLYEPIVYDSEDANGFGVVIQCVSDTYCTPLAKAYNAGEDGLVYSIVFVTPIDTLSSSVVPRSGDILSYGYLDDGEFNTITNEMLITNMAQTERGYRLDLVDYNEAIYEYGEIPVYTPNITPTRITKYVPAAPQPATLDDVANAIQIVTTNGDPEWIPDTVSAVQAVASQNEIAISWEWSGSGIANNIKRFIVELTKNGGTDWAVIAEPNSNTAAYSFDRDDDGYPEADDFSTWRVRVKAENVYGIVGEYGPDDAGQAVDSSLYIGWTPATPAINTRVSGRGVSVGWSFATKWYGQGDVDLQIAKGYTVDAEGEIELITETDTLVAYAPATGVDPVASYENYREGAVDGFLTRAGNAFFIALPLYGQNEDPISSRDTPYYIRVRSVSNQPTTAAPSGRETSDWTTWTLVYAHASSAQDVIRAWKLNDLGEKVKIDGALGADQIYVNFLAALSSNLGVITDGALQGNENNMWALSRIYEDDGITVKYYEGTLRVGDSNQYLRCTPVVSGGVVTSYSLEFKVGSFLVTAVGSVINGEFEVRNPAGTVARLKVDSTTGATIVSGGGEVSLSAGTGRLLIGNPAAAHMAIDENEIMAKVNGTTVGPLYLNAEGGLVECGGDLAAKGSLDIAGVLSSARAQIANTFIDTGVICTTQGGFLITTDIPVANVMTFLEFTMHAYIGGYPVMGVVQCYPYTPNSAILTPKYTAIGDAPPYCKIFFTNNKLCFWLPKTANYQTLHPVLHTHIGSYRILSTTAVALPSSRTWEVTANVLLYAKVNTATSATATDLPVGSYIIADGATPHNTNTAVTVRLNGGRYTISTEPSWRLSGTWRTCGYAQVPINSDRVNYHLVRRVA